MRIIIVIGILIAAIGIYFHNIGRSYELERQDKDEASGNYTREQFYDMMHILADLNLADPNGAAATIKAFRALQTSPESILEIGTGLGQFGIVLAQYFPNATVLGIDTHQLSIDSANFHLNSINSTLKLFNVRFEHRMDPRLAEDNKSVDVITTTFVNHHIFPDDDFVEFIKKVSRVGRKAFIFNDFHRSPKCIVSNDIQLLTIKHIGMNMLTKIAQYLPKSMTNSFIRYKDILKYNRPGLDLVIDGGMLSMRRSFTMQEYHNLFRLAGYPESALQCEQLDKWHDVLSTCRVVCVADLAWNSVVQ